MQTEKDWMGQVGDIIRILSFREGLDPEIMRPFKEANLAISRRMSNIRKGQLN
jgi:hypothetical protein